MGFKKKGSRNTLRTRLTHVSHMKKFEQRLNHLLVNRVYRHFLGAANFRYAVAACSSTCFFFF